MSNTYPQSRVLNTLIFQMMNNPRLPSRGNTIPAVNISKPKATRSSVNRTATSQEHKNQVTSAANALVPMSYGPCQSGINIFAMGNIGTDFVIGGWFALGEIEEIVKVRCNDDDVPVAITITEYTGTTTQTADATLASAISGYADDLVLDINGTDVGVAYIVARIPKNAISGFPRFTVEWKGFKNIYDPRDESTDYSDNPALCFRDWLKSPVYGAGFVVDDDSVKNAADYCDGAVGDTWTSETAKSLGEFVVPTTGNTLNRTYVCTTAGTTGVSEPSWNTTLAGTTNDGDAVWTCRDGRRYTVGMLMDRQADITAWIETWRTACGCMVVNYGENGMGMVPDTARDTDHTITHAAGQIMESPSISLKKEGLQNIPTVVKVIYTDTSGQPWRDGNDVRVAAVGVDAGTVPARESIIRAPWCVRRSQAGRMALERLNAATLTDLSFSLPVFDEGLKMKAGDIVEVTHPIGLSSKKMRILDIYQSNPGRWTLNLYEYDPLVYSNYIETEPSSPDFVLNTGVEIDFDNVIGDNKPDDNADNTASNRQSVAWLTEAVAAVLPVANTSAKCTDAEADKTSTHKANDTKYINGSINQSGQGAVEIYQDLKMQDGIDATFYSGGVYRGGIYGAANGIYLSAVGAVYSDSILPSGSGEICGASSSPWEKVSSQQLEITTGDISMAASGDPFVIHVWNGASYDAFNAYIT